MLKRLRGVLVMGLCLLAMLFALPSLLPSQLRAQLPAWLAEKSMVLGLDLQGGVHLLLEMQEADLMAQKQQSLMGLLKTTCRKEKIYYKTLRSDQAGIAITLVRPEDLPKLKTLIDSHEGQGQWEAKDQQDHVLVTLSKKAHDHMVRQAVSRSIEIIRKRIDKTGALEPILQSQGRDRIILQIPGFDNPARVRDLLGTTAKLTFQWVDPKGRHTDPLPLDQSGQMLPIDREVLLTGEDIVEARAGYNPDPSKPESMVSLRFTSKGTRLFSDLTQSPFHGRLLAIVLDGKILSAPRIQGHIPNGQAHITGNFSMEEAQNLALMINSGALPAPLTILEEKVVGPGLGQDSITAGTRATILAIGAVAVWMMIVYGGFGIFTVLGLAANLFFLITAMVLLKATLTLPGLAGIALTVGMAVDANVLINERIKDEIRQGKSFHQAINLGYERAKKTILDSNITTLTAALILYLTGTGPIKGFALTMALGILISLFTSIGLTKMFVSIWLRRFKPQRLWI